MADIRPRKTRQITDEEVKLKRENEELRSRIDAALKHVASVVECRTEDAIESWVTTLNDLLRGGPDKPAARDIVALQTLRFGAGRFTITSRGYEWFVSVSSGGDLKWERLPKQ